METDVVVALIAGFVALFGAVIANIQAHRTQKQATLTQIELARKSEVAAVALKELQARIDAQAAEHSARRDYEYEARKRLYAECEPLFFQLNESARGVIGRARRIAEAACDGHLSPGSDHWLGDDGYFMLSTMHRVIAPLVYVRLLQEALTNVDLTVDSVVASRYRLAQALYESFADDYALAEIDPVIPYDPNDERAAAKLAGDPPKYTRQGLYTGLVDTAVDALIKRHDVPRPRCLTFGEFTAEYGRASGTVQTAFAPVRTLFREFHPDTRPVLWRIVLAQAYICHELRQVQSAKIDPAAGEATQPLPPRAELDPSHFAWWRPEQAQTGQQQLQANFAAVRVYLDSHLAR